MYNTPMYYPNPAAQMAQQRLQMMEAQYPQFASNPPMGYQAPPQPQPQQPQIQPQTLMKGRPVSNAEEANAAMIDFDGSLFVFPDKAHRKIYTKQLGLDGNIIFMQYSLDNSSEVDPTIETTTHDYVEKTELENRLAQIQDKISVLEKRIPVQKSYSKEDFE